MKKIILLFTFLVSLLFATNAQISYNFGASMSFYDQLNENSYNLRPSIEPNIGFSYYFTKNLAVTTGLYAQKRYFKQSTNTIYLDNFQIPLMLTLSQKNNNFPIGLTGSLGYSLSFPTNITTSNNENFDVKLIHGIYATYALDVWLTNKTKFYIGLDGGIDFANKNNIKFIKTGILMGLSIRLKE